MDKIEEHWTLEDLFYNREDLSGWEIIRWLRLRYPGEFVEPTKVDVIKSYYIGWKLGTFRVEGDKVGLREWDSN